MDLLLVSESGLLRNWSLEFEVINEEESDELEGAHEDKQMSGTITLVNFDSTLSVSKGSS